MGSAFHLLCPRYSGTLTPTVSTATVKPVSVATSIKQAACIEQACIEFPKLANVLKCTYIKQAIPRMFT